MSIIKLKLSPIFVFTESLILHKMKKFIFPAIIGTFAAFMLFSTSCNNRICIKCYKINDSTDTQEFCSVDQNWRNDFIVEQTHNDYNCVQVEE